MIDPVNPGPAGTTGPAGTAIGPTAPGYIQSLLIATTSVIAQAFDAAKNSIQAQIAPATATVQQAIQTAAGSIAGAVNSAETLAVTTGAQAKASIAAQTPTLTQPPTTGKTTEQGAAPGMYAWEIWSVKSLTGWGRGIVEPRSAGYSSGPDYCFRGGSDDFFDAINIAKNLPDLPYGACPSPGGIATPPVAGPTPPTLCKQWAVWVFPAGSASTCSYAYCDGSVPDPSGQGGSKMLFPDQQSAESFANSSKCQTGGTGPTLPTYYGGCVSGKAVSWSSTDPVPQGVSGQVGPFSDATAALAAAGACGGIGPPSGTGSGSNGACCDPATGQIKLPDCIFIDLCDWSKFYENMKLAIHKGMCEFVKDPTCACTFRDADAAIYEDCDGQLSTIVDSWKGSIGSVVTDQGLDTIVSNGQQLASTLGQDVQDTGPDPFRP